MNKQDFLQYLESRTPTPTSPSPVPSQGERVEIIPMDNMRKAIARNMLESKQTSPHVSSVEEVDMTTLVRFRERFKKDFATQEGFSLTYTHFIMYAIVQALKEYPLVNASLEGDNILVKKDINLGCAVAVPGNGLVVPVIKGGRWAQYHGACPHHPPISRQGPGQKAHPRGTAGGNLYPQQCGQLWHSTCHACYPAAPSGHYGSRGDQKSERWC